MVEKIKRDVRITTIYEGTSEIMEWTIAATAGRSPQDPGAHYRDWAVRLEAHHAAHPEGRRRLPRWPCAPGGAVERCRLDRLTRNQHVLFRLGELIA